CMAIALTTGLTPAGNVSLYGSESLCFPSLHAAPPNFATGSPVVGKARLFSNRACGRGCAFPPAQGYPGGTRDHLRPLALCLDLREQRVGPVRQLAAAPRRTRQ